MYQGASVVIPTFNRERTILRAVESALNQGHLVAEVIVVDDASTDETQSALAACADPRLRVLRLASRQGACVARNTGINAASGDVVSFLDADDEWLPGYLESQLTTIGTALATVSGLVVIDRRGRSHEPPCDLGAVPIETMLLDAHGTFSSSCIVVARAAVHDGVRFDPSFPALQDLDLLLQIAHLGPISVNPDRLVLKHAGTPGRVFSGSNIPAARRQLLEKWATELAEVPGATGRQVRKLAAAAMQWDNDANIEYARSRLRTMETRRDHIANPLIRVAARLHPRVGAATARAATYVDRRLTS